MVNKKRGSKILFALCFIAYTVIYIGRKNYSACMSAMIADSFIDKTVGGGAGTAFLAVYACGQFVNGLLGDRISPRYMISGGLFGAALMNAALAVNPIAALVPVFWGMNGFFCSMLWSPIVRCISEWLPEEKRSDAGVQISVTLPVGSISSYLICAAMLELSGWRAAFGSCAAILAVTSLIFYFGVGTLDSYIREAEIENTAKRKNSESGKTDDKHGVSLPKLIIMTGLSFAVLAILFNGILKDGLDLWVPTLICEYFGMSSSFSSLLTAVLPIVNLAGVIFCRTLDDKFFHNEMTTAAVLFGVSMVSFIPLLILTTLFGGKSNVIVALIAVIFISITSSSMLGANTMILTFIPFHFSNVGRSSSVTGFLNCCSYAAAAVSGITVGAISGSFGWVATVIMFAACSVAGGAVCMIGSGFWKRGRERIK